MQTDHTLTEPIRAYLLGLLADDEAAALEEQYFIHRKMFLRIQSEERILIADYLEGHLNAEEHRSFEARYYAVPELQRKVEEMRRQRDALRPIAKPPARTFPPLAIASAFAMVLALCAGIWTIYRRPKPAQPVAQVQPVKESSGGTQAENQPAEQPAQAANSNQLNVSIDPGNDPVAFNSGPPVFIASERLYLPGERGRCAISSGDVLLRTMSMPYDDNTVDVNVVRSKPGNCPVNSYLQVNVDDLQEMRRRFQERVKADMQRLQSFANQATQDNAAAVTVSTPIMTPTPVEIVENIKAVGKPDHTGPSFALNHPETAPQIAEKSPNTKEPQPQQRSTLDTAPLPVDSTIYPNRSSAGNTPVSTSSGSNDSVGKSSVGGVSIQEQLQAQYPLARGTDGCHIGNPETALVTQSNGGGMRILPITSDMRIAKCVNSFADGKLRPASSACNGESVGKVGGWMSHIPGRVGNATGVGSNKVNDQAARQQMDLIATGDDVYLTNLDVNESKGEIKFTFVTCKSSGDQQNPYKGELAFKFKNLNQQSTSQIEDTISQVFLQGGEMQGNTMNGGHASYQNNDSPQANNQASTCNPEVGQTLKQVTDACGQPANQTKGATKTQLFYIRPKIKVILVNGKVSDIE